MVLNQKSLWILPIVRHSSWNLNIEISILYFAAKVVLRKSYISSKQIMSHDKFVKFLKDLNTA